MENNNTEETNMEEYVQENYVVAQPQNRLRSWALWVSVAGAVWVILEAFGLPDKWGISESMFRNVLDAVGSILIAFGILNNPTDKYNF